MRRFEPAESRLLHEEVMASLLQALVEGQLAPGERLTEDEVARELGVSRSPVRRAFHEMSRQGLLTLLPRKGAQVASWTAQDVQDFWHIRSFVEGLAAEQAAMRRQKSDIERLSYLAAQVSSAYREGAMAVAIEGDLHLHSAIVLASYNKFLGNVYVSMGPAIQMFMIAEKRLYPPTQTMPDMGKVHELICKAIENRESGRARELMEQHIREGAEGLVARMDAAMPRDRETLLPLVIREEPAKNG